jgi:hypothetical protein
MPALLWFYGFWTPYFEENKGPKPPANLFYENHRLREIVNAGMEVKLGGANILVPW